VENEVMPFALSPSVRRRLKAVAAVVLGVLLLGATYQGVATALERRDHERPGRLVDVDGGYQLHIVCAGEGSPTVVLEAAAGGMSAAWAWVQPVLAEETRVCSYDRARLGWSEGAADGYEATRVPDELHTLLVNAGEPAPFVLVGHGVGASFARAFGSRFAADTAGLVLVEEAGGEPDGLFVTAWPWLARIGVLRATGRLTQFVSGLPEEPAGALRAFLNRPDHLARAAAEVHSAGAAAALAGPLPEELPVVRIATVSRGLPALITTPDQAAPVIAAVRDALAEARTGGARR
jgi:pimeloyl-ACP methyl ester carboxylesterase